MNRQNCLNALFSLVGILSFATSSPGEVSPEENDSPSPHQLDEAVMLGEPVSSLGNLPESEALELVTERILESDLRRTMPATASDALAAAPGIHTETRGRKYKQFHSFRGQVYPYPDIALDGIWQRDARELFYVYPAPMLEGIEIVRSPSTLFHGLADVVGVINLIPRQPLLDPDAPPTTEVGLEGGTFGTVRSYGLHERGTKAGAFHAGGNYYRTDGRSGRNAGEEIYTAFGSVLLQPDPDHRIQGSAWLMRGYRELEKPDPDGPASNALKNRLERYDPLTFAHVNLRGDHHWGDWATTNWTLFLSDRRARYERRKLDPAGPGPGDTVEDEDDREFGAQFIHGIPLTPDNTLRFGTFLHRWTAPNGKQSYVGSRQDVSSFALVLADEQRLDAWTLDAGFRYAHSYLHDFSGPSFDVAGRSTEARRVRNAWDDPVLSGTAGATFAVNDQNQLFAHGGIGQRQPGPGAVRVDGSSPDTELRFTTDTGWALSWGEDETGSLKISGFGVWRRNAITRINQTAFDASGNEFYFSDNRDIRQQGVEVHAETPLLWHKSVNFFGGLTWMRSEETVDGSYRKLREIPSLVLTTGMQLQVGRWDANISVKHVDHYENFRFAQDGEFHDLGDYWDVTLLGGVRVGREGRVRIYGAVDNALDESYSTVVGWSDPGRRFRIGVQAEL